MMESNSTLVTLVSSATSGSAEEAQPLLPSSSQIQITNSHSHPVRHICLPSKGAILILLWTIWIGFLNCLEVGVFVVAADSNIYARKHGISVFVSLPLCYVCNRVDELPIKWIHSRCLLWKV